MGMGCCCGCEKWRGFTDTWGSLFTERTSGDWVFDGLTDMTLDTSEADTYVIGNASVGASHTVTLRRDDITSYSNRTQIRIILAYVDDDNYLFVELDNDFDGGGQTRFSIWQRASGTNTMLKSRFGFFTPGAYLSACWSAAEGRVTAATYGSRTNNFSSSLPLSVSGVTASGVKAGIGVGLNPDGVSIPADYAVGGTLATPCTPCFCENCLSGTAPASWNLTLSGVASDDCSNCEDYNGRTFRAILTTTSTDDGWMCVWQHQLAFPSVLNGLPCFLEPSWLTRLRVIILPGVVRVEVRDTASSGTPGVEAYGELVVDAGGNRFDCNDTFIVDMQNNSTNRTCDWSSAQVTIEPLIDTY